MDIYNQTIICNQCKKPTEKSNKIKDGFKIRTIVCKKCKREWEHPEDKENYKKFISLRNKPYCVKLRVVGNSWTVSIPKEIIRYHQIQESQMIKMFLKERNRLILEMKKMEEDLL